MDRTVSTTIIIAVILLSLSLMLVGWRRRVGRQSDIGAPQPVPVSMGEASIRVPVLYVATTRAGAPLDRVAVHGLGFRARGEIAVHPEGAVIAVDGREPWLVAREHVRGSGRATWTIDRVVEEGGLIMLAWTLDGAEVDSYFRVTDASAIDATAELLAALATLAPSIPTGDEPATPAPTERDPS
ncbi:transporter [Microcella alkalica]|uniref:PH domain-containing protein n=1 Tax=Microcella alkalica TaxID=355930 RepID=A0A839ECL6_9MICO|nr:hypothetical protein [Microcella alkalica]MBA8847075.1 hypothetical protein [Microcella alkalica]